MRRVVVVLRSGEELTFEDRRGPDGTLRQGRFEQEADGHVSVYSDHVVVGADGTEEVVDTFRPARFSPDKLLSITVEDD